MTPNNDPISEQELVLIYVEEHPTFFARVEKITPDVKPKWWQVKLLVLTIPPNLVTWILDEEQIRGADFSMSGIPVRIEKVVLPREPKPSQDTDSDDSESSGQKARILSLHKK